MKDVWEFAKKMEKESEEFYKELATQTTAELSGVFTVMAREEAHHFELFAALQRGQAGVRVQPGTVLTDAKAAFARLAKGFKGSSAIKDSADAYRKVLEMERNAVTYYTEAKTKTQDKALQTILERIIGEERNHVAFAEGLLEFVKRPKEWLENSEWNNLKPY